MKIRSSVKEMTENIVLIYRDKGFAPFKKPLMVAVPVFLIVYAAIYLPVKSKLSSGAELLLSKQTISANAAEYEEARNNLAAYQRRLPLLKEKEEWLNYLTTSTARAYGITFEGLRAQTETEAGNFLVVSREVSVNTSYVKLGKWLADLEKSPIFVRVEELSVKKDDNSPGVLKVTFRISTIFPKFRAEGSTP